MIPILVTFAIVAPPPPNPKADERPLSILLKRLKSEEHTERRVAARGLGAYGDRAATVALAAQFVKEDDDSVKRELAYSLFLLGSPSEKVVEFMAEMMAEDKPLEGFSLVMRAEDPKGQRWGQFAAFVPLLLERLQDDNKSKLFSTVLDVSASRQRDPKLLPPLIAIVRKGSGERFSAAMQAALLIPEFGAEAKKAITPLRDLMESRHTGESLAAAAALITILSRDEAAEKRLADAIDSAEGGTNYQHFLVLSMRPEAAGPVRAKLAAKLIDKTVPLHQRQRYARLIGSLGAGGKDVRDAVVRAMADKDLDLKAMSALAVVAIDNTNCDVAVPALRAVLQSGEHNMAGLVAERISEVDEASDRVFALAEKEFPGKRYSTAIPLAIAVLKRKPKHPQADAYVRKILTEGATDTEDNPFDINAFSRANAAKSVRSLAGKGRAYREDLIPLLSSKEDWVVVATAETLRGIAETERTRK